tara:strand:- start:1173 stop:2594 length:1422 start_codon:yes stop_codon:yes gene_type:complete
MTATASGAFQADLETVLKRQIGGFKRLKAAERLSGGASQETYRLTLETESGVETLALRRAPPGVGENDTGPGLAMEAELFRVARSVGVPGPEIHYVLEVEDGLGAGFLMEWIDGETLGAKIARSEDFAEIRPRLAYQCGQILARIHGMDVSACGLDRHLTRLTPEAYIHQTWDNYKKLDAAEPMIDYTARWLLENLPPELAPQLVHNDFRNGNLIVSKTQGVVAVLDWEIAHIGDPMRDLGWICTGSWQFGQNDLPAGGFGRREDLFAGYEAESGRKIDPDHVRFWEVFGSFWWAVGCLRMGERYRQNPSVGVEYPAIGRRSSECQVDCVNLLIPGPVSVPEADVRSLTADLPGTDEILTSVRDFLRQDVMAVTEGRNRFLARVGANALDIVLREVALGERHRLEMQQGLASLLGCEGALGELKKRLVDALREGKMPLDMPGLAEYLRNSVVRQVAIDQPSYPGYRQAIAFRG